MAAQQQFRAPRGPEVWREGPVGLAGLPSSESRVDTSLAAEKKTELVAIGDLRIDNRKELSAALGIDPGATDIRILLTAYRAWGDDCPARLLGDFAFAVWDGARRRLLLARDAMGMRPLFYAVQPGRILIASEIEQLLEAGVEPRLAQEVLAAFLTGLMPAGGSTFYRGVDELPPGMTLVATAEGHSLTTHWQPDPSSEIRYKDEWDYAEHLREIFRESVSCRLHTDAPVGILLSGGLDSGAAASTAAQLIQTGESNAPELRPYSWAFEEFPQCDERHISRFIVEHYGLDATDVSIKGAWPLDEYPAHGPHRDEPRVFAYQPLIERSLRIARDDGVRIMLSGDRGDLTMGGWSLDYVALLADHQWSVLRDEVHRHRKATGESMGAILSGYLLRPAWRRMRARGLMHTVRRVTKPDRFTTTIEAPPWLAVGISDTEHKLEAQQPSTMPTWSQQQRFDWIFDDFQMRGMLWSERTYARHGVVFADPWSDRRIAEFALSVPQQILNRPGEVDKRLVREAMAGVMPEPAREQAAKILPTPLFDAALRGPGQAAAWDLLQARNLEALGLVDSARLQASYEGFLGGEKSHHDLWWPMTAEWWLRSYWGDPNDWHASGS